MKKYNLSIDTSGRVGSVALSDGTRLVAEQYFTDQMRHAAELIPAIIELTDGFCRPAELDCVFVTTGPGSFTGLRIGLSCAKMMALASDVKLVALSSLDCTMQNALALADELGFEQICVVTDAKRGQFFVSIYRVEGSEAVKTTEDCLLGADAIMDIVKKSALKTAFLGEGLKFYSEKFASELSVMLPEELWGVKAANVAKLGEKKRAAGEFESAETILPSYLRLSDAEENAARRAAAS
ncbi:MAG: tRNA (adenosine(37)-N6)-threonylcarbamoyltransferase complex dimerization subunit type 1 TsaB [Phycisphaerae bacterium]